jgi:octaprenyl-diphosphate synthase
MHYNTRESQNNTRQSQRTRKSAVGVVVPFEEPDKPSASLKPLVDLTAADMADINRLILDDALSDVPMIPKLAHHLIESGGKRLRPMLAIAASKLCGYQGREHIRTAASVEFLHTATLLHDDVVDDSDTRRGRKTARLIWGNQASVLVGDFLLGRSFLMLVETKSLPVLALLSQAAATLAEGEVMQLAAAKNTSTTEDDYLAIINAKTAALFSAAAESGAALAGRPAGELAALRSYGRNIGIAFQLVDDALDYSGKAESLGKAVGDDFREGKITLPVILAFRRSGADERDFWERTIANGDIHDGDLEHAMDLMQKHKAIEATLERAKSYADVAHDALQIFPDSDIKSAMLEVIAFCIQRRH